MAKIEFIVDKSNKIQRGLIDEYSPFISGKVYLL